VSGHTWCGVSTCAECHDDQCEAEVVEDAYGWTVCRCASRQNATLEAWEIGALSRKWGSV